MFAAIIRYKSRWQSLSGVYGKFTVVLRIWRWVMDRLRGLEIRYYLRCCITAVVIGKELKIIKLKM